MDALRRNRLEVRRVKRAARATARAHEWRLPLAVRNTAVIIYDLTGFRAEPVARYLAAVGRQRGWQAKSTPAAKAFVEDMFIALMNSTDAHVIPALVDVAEPSDVLAMHTAQRWAEEWDLFCWAELQNTERGVAPSTRALLARLTATRAAAGRPPPGTTAHNKARKWAMRFRWRWGGHFGSIPATDCVPLGELMDKAFQTHRSGWLSYVSCMMCYRICTRMADQCGIDFQPEKRD